MEWWEHRTVLERVLTATISQMFIDARYAAAKVPTLLRNLADQIEQHMHEHAASGRPPCSCEACENHRKADAAKYN